MHSTVAELYMSNDQLLKLDDYIAKDNVDLGNYYEDIVQIYNYNGSQYAVPKDHDTIALLYNKAIFDQYGVEYPNESWTWDDLYTAAKAITDASGRLLHLYYGRRVDGNSLEGLYPSADRGFSPRLLRNSLSEGACLTRHAPPGVQQLQCG